MALEIGKQSVNRARQYVLTGIREGIGIDSFLGHMAEANLAEFEIKAAFAQLAENAAAKKDIEAETARASTVGVEREVPSAGEFETNRAKSLRALAKIIRGN